MAETAETTETSTELPRRRRISDAVARHVIIYPKVRRRHQLPEYIDNGPTADALVNNGPLVGYVFDYQQVIEKALNGASDVQTPGTPTTNPGLSGQSTETLVDSA